MKRNLSSWASRDSRLAWLTAFTLLSAATGSFAQQPLSPQIGSDREPWTEGTVEDALAQSASGATIPMTHYTFTGPRGTFKGVLVGGDPFGNPNPVTIEAVLIPLIVYIQRADGTLATFDPTASDPCDLKGGFSAEYRFRHSPLVVASDLVFNDVSVGNAQYIDGFNRILFGEGSLRRALTQFQEHYVFERNHQGKGNILLFSRAERLPTSYGPSIRCHQRLGGLLKYYYRRAA